MALDNHDLLWNNVSGEHERIQRTSSLVHGKVAVAAHWPFLSGAVNEADFENRLAVINDRLSALLDPSVFDEVVASLREDYSLITAAKGTDDDTVKAVHADAEEQNDKETNDDKDDEGKRTDEEDNDGDDDDEDNAGMASDGKDDDSDDDDTDDDKDVKSSDKPDWLKNKGDKKKSSKTAITSINNPAFGRDPSSDNPYINGSRLPCPSCNQWGKFQDGSTCEHCEGKGYLEPGAKKHATNYQPDPNAAWRYYAPYNNLRQPVNNGDLQDSDGFPVDLAQGEGRSNEVIEQRQLTPGTWTVHDAMPERPMPFSQERGYQPVASLQYDAEGFVVESYGQHVDKGPSEWHFNEGYQHGLQGVTRKGYGGRPAAISYGAGYDAGTSDRRAHRWDEDQWDDDYQPRHSASLSFDKEGFVVQSFEGRGVDPLTDPAPGTPQAANPYYFNDGSGMGENAGFPVDPGPEPLPNHLDEIYGETPPQSSAGSNEGTIDGKGYSRSHPGGSATASARPNFT